MLIKRKYVLHIILLVLGVLMIVPFIWMISTSLKSYSEVYVYPPTLIPEELKLENFIRAWNAAPFARFFINSIFVTISITFGQVLTGILAGYAFARLNFKGKNYVFLLFLSTLMIPRQVILIPVYVIISKIGWVDTYQALIFPFIASAFSVFLLRQHFLSIPKELEEAAIIDGCSKLKFIFKILVPLSKPAIAAVTLFSFRAAWNQYLWPLIVINSEKMRTLQIGLRYFVSQGGGNSEWHYLMALSLIVMLPVLIVFLSSQKYFIRGIASTGLKY